MGIYRAKLYSIRLGGELSVAISLSLRPLGHELEAEWEGAPDEATCLS